MLQDGKTEHCELDWNRDSLYMAGIHFTICGTTKPVPNAGIESGSAEPPRRKLYVNMY